VHRQVDALLFADLNDLLKDIPKENVQKENIQQEDVQKESVRQE